MMDTRSRGGSGGIGCAQGGHWRLQRLVCHIGNEIPPKQPSNLMETILDEMEKALRDALPTLLDAP